jgi:serine/threonine protein kinase
MAPEVAFNQEYTKSVDIWSIGIIMYVILTGGKHPIYVNQEDSIETYKKKLYSCEEFDTPEEFSWLAKNLFQRLTKY